MNFIRHACCFLMRVAGDHLVHERLHGTDAEPRYASASSQYTMNKKDAKI